MQKQKSFLMYVAEMWEEYRNAPSLPGSPAPKRRLRRWLMPNGGTLILIILLILTQNLWASPGLAPNTGNTPGPSATTINYQGRLANSGGTPENGNFNMTFSLYDAGTGGNVVWGPEAHTAVPVSAGLFSVGLGSLTSGGIPTSVWNGDIYLEVIVNGEALTPRELIRSVPIAGMALTVPDGAISSAEITYQSPILNNPLKTSSTAFVDFPLTDLNHNFTTTGENSTLITTLNGSAFLRSAATEKHGGVEFRFVLDGNVYGPETNGFRYFFNEPSSHRAFSWHWIFKNLPPGNHTLKLQWRSVDNDDEIIIDYNDDFTLSVLELKK